MEDYISVSRYRVSGYGSFTKWWYRVEVHNSDGRYGLGFGATRLAAIKRALKDSVKDGGRVREIGAGVLSVDEQGRLMCRNKSGQKYVLSGEHWIRVSR